MSGPCPPEAADLAAAQAGDDEAFARIYDRLAPVVVSLCRGRGWGAAGGSRDLAEAQDAAQETFLRAHRMLHKVEQPEKLRPWLFAIARRVCSERGRAARRRRRHEERASMSRATGHLGPPPAAASPAARTERAEQLERLGTAMEKLDDRERLAIHLYYLEADPIGAASSALGLSRSGYYKLLARARERLAALMTEGEPT